MEFHPDKCKMLRITNKRKIIESCYYIHGHELENVTEAKYLGVTLTKKMSWNTHIILEYTASVLDPVENSTLTNKIEMVRRKAARCISNRWDRT